MCCHGPSFSFDISFPPITTTQTPPNKESVIEFADEFNKIVHNKMQKGWYIGPFQLSPFSIIPKPAQIDKHHSIQNYSILVTPFIDFPNSSINLCVDSDSVPTTWGTFSVISLLIHQLPPGLQLAIRDVMEVYCTILLHHSQWPSTVVCPDNDPFPIDTALHFWSGPLAGMYGTVQNAAADILCFQGIGPISRWVDNHLFICTWCSFLPEYNQRHRAWNRNMVLRGKQQEGGRIWFGGQRLEDGTLKEFDEECTFPCKDLLVLTA